MNNNFYLADGWGALKKGLIFSPSQAPLPISPNILVTASQHQWPHRTKVFLADSRFTQASVLVRPDDDPSFTIDLYKSGKLMGFDGTPEQNVRLAAWLRSLMPKEAPRMVVTDQGLSVHSELPHGVTPEQIAATMVSHSIDGWDADDPEWQAI